MLWTHTYHGTEKKWEAHIFGSSSSDDHDDVDFAVTAGAGAASKEEIIGSSDQFK
jgi:hypothetical protein